MTDMTVGRLTLNEAFPINFSNVKSLSDENNKQWRAHFTLFILHSESMYEFHLHSMQRKRKKKKKENALRAFETGNEIIFVAGNWHG